MARVHSSKRNRTLNRLDNANAESTSKKQRNNRDISDEESLSSSSDTNTSSVVTPRENEFNSKTWWRVDLSPVKGSPTSPQGATALVKRCMRVHSWDEKRARKILAAYRQFLLLKERYGDWNAEMFSPCFLVDQMWHCHILDVVNYYHDMILLCGHIVGHNPDGSLDIEAKQKRDENTCLSLRKEFGIYDEEVWGYSPAIAANNTLGSRSGEVYNADEEIRSPLSDNEFISIGIKYYLDDTKMFKIRKTERLGEVFRSFAERKGVDRDNLRFLLFGETVGDEDTSASLELEEGDYFDCFLPQGGC